MHELNLLNEYKRKCNSCGIQPIFSTNTTIDLSTSIDASSKWQHPEKQKTLIHTAPVLSPTPEISTRNTAPRNTAEVLNYIYAISVCLLSLCIFRQIKYIVIIKLHWKT